ncbi:DNA-processing protein DprA [Nesterenkonia alkaliphila]|uniref:DNA processing protein DprA n=1 Tax=Nesterenkonia alkaliphila TaxID=1463631 RepID=A0A7K1ULW4_9MICC|nr:DNA-processing protein DprA [Nesterenkonia alkaliphila]MVT27479.1 DNA processing protein DprA [Nesterenkonia alkaliphila]GFZ89369.1 DNA processing protein DprA [Nesterenkonia alkaliphila]
MRAAEPEWAATTVRRARAELCRLIEPGDLLGAVTISALGAEAAHRLLVSGREPAEHEQQRVGEAAEAAGLSRGQRRLAEGLQRWRTRLLQLTRSEQMLNALHRIGGGVLVPEDACWPEQLQDLGAAQPLCLWFRTVPGAQDPYARMLRGLPQPGRSLAVVGAREATDYGSRIAWESARELAGHAVTVVSGGAYGIDAAAHRGALSATEGAPTIAVLAGGVDRFYPAGNASLLNSIAEQGLILSEMAPGSSPTKSRFLQRNRLIAALAAATVVVEARWRSGALSTANHALSIGRPVGAVPGSVYSASSAGCHRLLRETPAQLVTDAADAVQLVLEQSTAAGTQGISAQSEQPSLPMIGQPETCAAESVQPVDGLNDLERRVYDALPARRFTTSGKLSEVAGIPVPQVLTSLTRLRRKSLAREENGEWGRARRNMDG